MVFILFCLVYSRCSVHSYHQDVVVNMNFFTKISLDQDISNDSAVKIIDPMTFQDNNNLKIHTVIQVPLLTPFGQIKY